MDKAIGGYFELELRKGEHFHKHAIRLNTARNGFEYILRAKKYKKVFIPYYTCEVMLEPISKLNFHYEFYHINEDLEPVSLPKLGKEEAFLYTNYFGLKQNCVKQLAEYYGKQLIIDNAQAFYAEPLSGIDTIYSPRKFFGVAEGAYLYTDSQLDMEFERDHSYDRMSHLLKRIDIGTEFGYQDFKNNDNTLIGNPIKQMSNLTEAILSSIDYNYAKQKRRENYLALAEVLDATNKLHFELQENTVPMVYPYLSENSNLKQQLIGHKVFVATYWPNVLEWCKKGDLEYELAKNVVFLPIDQRYGIDEMNKIIELIFA